MFVQFHAKKKNEKREIEREKKKAPYFVSQNIKQGSSCEEQGPKKGLQFRKILGGSDDDSER